MGKESKAKRDKRHATQPKPTCPACGLFGAHFAPPSLGEEGFFICQEEEPVFKTEMQVLLPKVSAAEKYAQENFRSSKDGDLVHIRRNCFNGNGLNESICFKNIEDAFEAGVAHQRLNMTKQIEETLADLRWGKMTIKDKLKFGLPEDVAIKQRERRCHGVFITAISELEELIYGKSKKTSNNKGADEAP